LIDIPGVDRVIAEDLITEAKRVCPYCNAFKGNIPIEILLMES